MDCDGCVSQALGNVGSHGVMKEIKVHAWDGILSVMQVNRIEDRWFTYGNPTPRCPHRWERNGCFAQCRGRFGKTPPDMIVGRAA